METDHGDEEVQPSLKRQKLNDSQYELIYGASKESEFSYATPIDKSKPSAFNPVPLDPTSTQTELRKFHISNYIPAGCIRLENHELQITSAIWDSQRFWAALTIPSDVYNEHDSPFLSYNLQNRLMRSSCLAGIDKVLNWGLVRLEFKTNDSQHGQVRVYVHKDCHWVRQGELSRQDKETRRAYGQLLGRIDISSDVWEGCWSASQPVHHIDPNLNESATSESLLSIFNTLPSPNPILDEVQNEYANYAMSQLMEGSVHGLLTELYPYQRRSAALMAQRESKPGLVVDPRLIKLKDQSGRPWYCDPEGGVSRREPQMYDAPTGGILAENMGLGKTLICLALILATRDVSSTVPPECSVDLIPIRKTTGTLVQMAGAAIGRQAVPWKLHLAIAESRGQYYPKAKQAILQQPGHYFTSPTASQRISRAILPPPRKILLSTTTLVVVPPNIFEQWLTEIKKHTTGLEVLAIKEAGIKMPNAEDLIQYDIVLLTKGRFDKEAKPTTVGTSPLALVHFKRLIYDEGHILGSSSSGAQTESYTLFNHLNIVARWIVSGTPTPGLYTTTPPTSSSDENSNDGGTPQTHMPSSLDDLSSASFDQPSAATERKDLMKLGNIATYFLKVRPWAPSANTDVALWSNYVLQPRHGAKSRGNVVCLRSALERMMVRHTLSDVELEIQLPPLHESVTYLDPSSQDLLTLNTFNLMVITNAVTSEREGQNYFFHPSQRKNLQSLVTNLRQGSFFWSGFEIPHVSSTIAVAQKYLEDGVKNPEDERLLTLAIQYGRSIISNVIWRSISCSHEMPMSVKLRTPRSVQKALALGQTANDDNNYSSSQVLIGATTLLAIESYMRSTKLATWDGITGAALKSNMTSDELSPATSSAGTHQLAGGVTVGREPSMRRSTRISTMPDRKPTSVVLEPALREFDKTAMLLNISLNDTGLKGLSEESLPILPSLRTAAENYVETSTITDCLGSAEMVSTASAKLSYLLDRIVQYHQLEKILVFYDSSNIGYYIAQYLECLNIEHLIYAKELKTGTRSRYVTMFNTTDTFRVLLMDVSQAAFGLDISSASRVFFVNPVFSPQIQAQAVKRAHRIGQLRPVYVETLVLKGSIEEVLLGRRDEVSKEDHQKLKSILDDQIVSDWIRNMQMLPMEVDGLSGEEQMARLAVPQKLFTSIIPGSEAIGRMQVGRHVGVASDSNDHFRDNKMEISSS